MATIPVSITEPAPRASAQPARRLIRVTAAAEFLGVSGWKIRGLIRAGELRAVQSTARSPFLVDVSDLNAWIERNQRTRGAK